MSVFGYSKYTYGQEAVEPAEEVGVVEDVEEISAEQNEYDFCLMQGALQAVKFTTHCWQMTGPAFLQEHGQEKFDETSVGKIGEVCFRAGAKSVLDMVEICKEHLEE